MNHRSSPHTRGCFLFRQASNPSVKVFPAYAGVFPAFPLPACLICSLPRIRGGVSVSLASCLCRLPSSPHTRGCFWHSLPQKHHTGVFPAYAGVFLRLHLLAWYWPSLPRIRGGVSAIACTFRAHATSSPHTRGCFWRLPRCRRMNSVFPAYAGVFLPVVIEDGRSRSLPRIRGGVSPYINCNAVFTESSPHTRGCFQVRVLEVLFSQVFPAYAGVFPLPVSTTSP